jgi:hypothetical protein
MVSRRKLCASFAGSNPASGSNGVVAELVDANRSKHTHTTLSTVCIAGSNPAHSTKRGPRVRAKRQMTMIKYNTKKALSKLNWLINNGIIDPNDFYAIVLDSNASIYLQGYTDIQQKYSMYFDFGKPCKEGFTKGKTDNITCTLSERKQP